MSADELKQLIKKLHLFQYQVARQLDVCEMTLIHWLRDLTPVREAAIRKAIEDLSAEHKECVNG